MKEVVDAVVGLSALSSLDLAFFVVFCSIGDATNRKTVRLIVAALRPDVDTAEVQVASTGSGIGTL